MLFALFLAAGPTDVLTPLRTELQRTMTLRLEDFPSPYFVLFALDDTINATIESRFGAVVQDKLDPQRQIYAEVRVGDYKFDNTAGKAEAQELDLESTYQPARSAPLSNDATAISQALWLLADDQYKAATASYYKKKGRRIYQSDDADKFASFSRERAVQALTPAAPLLWDRAGKVELAKQLSALLSAPHHVFDHDVQVSAASRTRYLVNSEGTAIANGRNVYGVAMTAYARAEDGSLLEAERAFYAAVEGHLPSTSKLQNEAKQMILDLAALKVAKPIDPYTGPAILAPEAAGVLFHEALGHRLEGERQKEDDDGQTFKGQIGQSILPEFIDVFDDPTLEHYGEIELNGFYRFDDEGVPAQKVALVDHGILKNYLLGRTPVEGFAQSNGHGRTDGQAKPQSRMATTEVVARKTVPYAKLKQLLMEEARRQHKPYGLILRDVSSGQTNTETGGYQAFKGSPRMVYLVDAKTGAETLVRGVELVGTPLSALSRIIAASDSPAPFNGYCGAESGFVPVSTLAPALLLSEIELQRTHKERQRPPLLPRPSSTTFSPVAR